MIGQRFKLAVMGRVTAKLIDEIPAARGYGGGFTASEPGAKSQTPAKIATSDDLGVLSLGEVSAKSYTGGLVTAMNEPYKNDIAPTVPPA